MLHRGQNGFALHEGNNNIPHEVHELISFGLAGEAANFHDTAESVNKYILRSRIGCVPVYDLNLQTEGRAQRVKAVSISFMNQANGISSICIFQCRTNLFAGHVELIGIILVEITGQRTEWALGCESERSSCSRHNPAEPMK